MKMSFLRRSVFDRWKPRMLSSFSPQSMHSPQPVPAVEPDHSEVQALLNTLAGLDLNKVMARRKEPLVVPHYQLMSLEQLQQIQEETEERAKIMLQPPPILPERAPCGAVVEVDEGLAGAIPHRMIFTETSQHKDNQLRTVVVRETDGILRQATWEERDRMYQAFFPTIGRKMWLPKALSTDVLPSTLNNMLHLNVLDLVCVQCDPQSHDYHRVHKHVYEDIEKRGCYDLLRSTRYFGSMVWYLLTSSYPPRIYGLLKDMLQRGLLGNATELLRLFMLCFPESSVCVKLKADNEVSSETNLIERFCEHSNFHELISFLQPHGETSESLSAV